MSTARPLERWLFPTLLLLALLPGSRMTARTAAEPLPAPHTGPLIALGGRDSSAKHLGGNMESVDFLEHIGGSTHAVFLPGSYACVSDTDGGLVVLRHAGPLGNPSTCRW